MKERNVLVVQRINADYRKAVFDKLAEQVNLIVTDTSIEVGIKHFDAPYRRLINHFRYSRKATGVFLNPFMLSIRTKSQIIIHEFAIGIISLPFMFLLCKLMGKKIFLWSHGYDRKRGFDPSHSLSDKYRLLLMKLANGLIVYGQQDKALLKQYINENKIFVAQNTLDTKFLFKIKEQLQKQGKCSIKKRFNIVHEHNIIFIGRMIKNKNPDLLYNIYKLLLKKYNLRVGVHFIGEGPMLQEIKDKVSESKHHDDFYFYGAIHDYEISGALLYACDIMVMPGDLGLSINHAFCFDCPVASYKSINFSPAHGPEIEYLIDGQTGFLTDHSADALSYKIVSFFNNPELRMNMVQNIRQMVQNVFPIESMIDGLLNCINSSKLSQ